MSGSTIRLHLNLSQEDCDRVRKMEEELLTEEVLQEYLEGFNEELDKNTDDYRLKLIKMAYLQGFYQGINSFGKISIDAHYDQDNVGEE